MATFLCWDPDVMDFSEAKKIEAESPSEAAEAFAESRFSNDSYPQVRDVHVAKFEEKVFTVEIRQNPEFHATEKK